MSGIFRILICIEIGLAILPVLAAETDAPARPSFLSSNAPRDIKELYLRFHEKELCRDVDALFVYDESGLEVWYRTRDGGSYGKLMKLIKPLAASFRVETYSSTMYPDENPEDEDTLPPGLWENSELREYLLSPFARIPLQEEFDTPAFLGSPTDLYRRRLRLFSDQTLQRGSELERLAAELPELTRMGSDHSLDPGLESLAARICIDHCREMEKLIGKLKKSLEQALPRDGRDMDAGGAPSFREGERDIEDLAVQISENSRQIFQSVRAFLYPERFTVQLEELRHPGILVSLEELRGLQEEYLKRMTQISGRD